MRKTEIKEFLMKIVNWLDQNQPDSNDCVNTETMMNLVDKLTELTSFCQTEIIKRAKD